MADNNHDHPNTEALGASPDPVALAGRWRREPHPLFPRDDDRPEDRDIQFVTFRRRRAGDRLVQNYPEEIPAREVRSWAQVVAWWGGGEYKALGKNAKHELVAVHPTGTDEWECFDGESKPFTFRNGSPYAEHPVQPSRTVEAPAAAPAPAPAAPNGLETQVAALGAQVSDLVREIRASHAAPPAAAAPPAPASNENILVAMINAQAQTSRDFQVQMQAAAARESENMRAMMTAILGQRPAEAKPAADPTASALAIVKELKGVIQPAPPQPPMTDTIASLKALKEISAPAASAAPAAPPSELSELFGGITAMMQAEASKAAVANVTGQAKPAPPEPRSRPRELYRVPGLGVVDLVAPEPPMTPPASPPARAASGLDFEAIKRDPALRARALAELGGIDVCAPTAAPPFAPAPPPMPPSAPPKLAVPTSAAPPTPPPDMPMPLPAQSAPSAPAPVPTAAAPNVAVPTSGPSPLTNAPTSGLDIEAIRRDPALRARLLAELGSDVSAVSGASLHAPPTMPTPPTAPSVPSAPAPVPTTAPAAPLPAPSESTPEPSAPAPVPTAAPSAPLPASSESTPEPSPPAPVPTAAPSAPMPPPNESTPEPSAPAPSESPPGPSAPAASDDQRASIAEPMHTAARGLPVVTDEYRARAVPSLRTIAGMPRDQQRAALSTLPGLEDEEAVNQIMEFFQLAASMPPELWVECVKRLPANTVRVLVDGPGG
jgi:hypothetical protein